MSLPVNGLPCSRAEFEAALIERHGAVNQEKLSHARIGIAGLGGLGSAVAFHLARLGVGTLVLVDFDDVDLTNLHRQQYTLAHLNTPKTEALASQLSSINPFITLETHQIRIDGTNAATLFDGCDVVVEAFDQADQKAMLIETLLGSLPNTKIVSGSGMAGMDSANTISTKRALANLYLCGDGSSDVAEAGTLVSPRVGVCAGHQANMVLRLILGETEP